MGDKLDLTERIKSIIQEIKDSGVPDRVIQSALVEFAKSAREMPLGDASREGHDSAVLNFLKDVVGECDALHVYVDFYHAAIQGEVYISR